MLFWAEKRRFEWLRPEQSGTEPNKNVPFNVVIVRHLFESLKYVWHIT